MNSPRVRRSAPDSAEQHRNWLSLIEVTGPFLSLPVLRSAWPTLDPLDKPTRERLRLEHTNWMADQTSWQRAWIDFVLRELLGWQETLHTDGLDALAINVPEHDAQVAPSFALIEPDEDTKPDTTRLLGLTCSPGQHPTARIKGETWAASPVDRLAQLCRHHEVELGLATDGRWWALVWAPRGGVTTTAVFDAVAWPEVAERDVVRAFLSLLSRTRFFGVPDNETLVSLLRKSLDSQEEITEALGVQVRQAVELLVSAIGRAGTAWRARKGQPGQRESEGADNEEIDLNDVDAHDVYRGAVSVMMRIVFLLFAEERGLLPSDNKLYASAYSAARLCAELERRALDGSEDDLEHTFTGWLRLLALFDAVYRGVEHPRLRMHAHDGSLFNPDEFPWLPLQIDDRTVLHMLRAVQYVEIGAGRSKERRTLSFRTLDVEQIGYVYEGLLAFDGFRAEDVVVGLIGKLGLEEEVDLRHLESLAAQCNDIPTLAAKLAVEYKDSKIGSAKALEKRLASPAGVALEEARKKLLAVVRGDYPLAERLLPFCGVIRRDLRDLPLVVMPGELYVTESMLRKNTGTHYTPRFLAEQVVEGALEPLVYAPGPLQTADKEEWKLKSSNEILALKIADIAMGSAAFLVAAARYLGAKLIEALTREGDVRVRAYAAQPDGTGADEDPVVIEARRQIIEHCLYGVDINPMAVEMAKLSLWLVSMDPHRPFTFLDDRLAAGDSLLGITSLEQLEYMHMDPRKGRAIHERALVDFTAGVRELVADVSRERRKLAEIDGTTMEGLARKRSALADIDLKTGRARLLADLCVGAALHYAEHGEIGQRDGSFAASNFARLLDTAERDARVEAREWLASDLPLGGLRREPLHWPLVFPEVFNNGGFDAIIGNPPFVGGQRLTGATGRAYREYLVHVVGGGLRGSADLVAYFILRAHVLLGTTGTAGIIAKSSLAEGTSKTVGLDQLIRSGFLIFKAIRSEAWPSRSADIRYCALWTTRLHAVDRISPNLDGELVAHISSGLLSVSGEECEAELLAANRNLAFQGVITLGLGFEVHPDQAHRILAGSPRNRDVLYPYLDGDDLNNSPDNLARRWVVNFHDWPEERCQSYPEMYQLISEKVRVDRQDNADASARKFWWRYLRRRPDLIAAIRDFSQVIAIARVSSTVAPCMVPVQQVFHDKVVVFASDDRAMLAALSSAIHLLWVIRQKTSHGGAGDTTYAHKQCFETFPLPDPAEDMRVLGDRLDVFRRTVMLSRNTGITKIYNRVFDPDCRDDDIEDLRRIHREIDHTTIRAYGWEERIEKVGGLNHGFHKVGRETRYTIGPAAQREVLDSLLELNHERHAEEVAQGMHDKKGKRKPPDDGTLF